MKCNNSFTFTADKEPMVSIVIGSGEEDREAAQIFQQGIKKIANVNLKIVSRTKQGSSKNQVLIGTPYSNPLIKKILKSAELIASSKDKELATNKTNKRLLIPEDLKTQAFMIYKSADGTSLILSGRTSQGVFYAVTTAIDRLFWKDKKLVIDNLDTELIPVINEPAFQYRSIATNIGGPDWLGHQQWEKEWGYDYKGFIDWLASHKINNLNIWSFDLAFGIAYNSKRFPECVNKHHPNVKKEFIKDMIDYAHKRYIEVFFFVDFPDNWTAIIKAYPELAGKNVDTSQIPSGKEWERYEKGGEGNPYSFRFKYSWICASNPKTMQFWQIQATLTAK